MRITESQLRRIIREELEAVREEDAASVGKEMKATSASEKAQDKIAKNPAVQTALKTVKTTADLTAFMQQFLKGMIDKGEIDQKELKNSLRNVYTSVTTAKEKK